MRTRLGPVLLVLVLALPVAAAAPGIVVYRCVGPGGEVIVQNTAQCPKGMKQQRRVIERPAPAATPTRTAPALTRPAVTPVVAVPAAAVPAAVAPADAPALRAAPEVMACRTREGESYFSDAALSTRCVPLRMTGIDRRSGSVGEACETVIDSCEPVAEAARCAAWSERRRVAEGIATFQPDRADAARDELRRIDAAVAGTVCGR